MKAFSAALAALLLSLSITLQYALAVSPAHCNAVEPMAGKVLDLINKGRRNGYIFELLRVADAHLDKGESSTVYYLVLDVIESDCSVLSRKSGGDCEPNFSRHPSHTVIGQCKVIAKHWNESQYLHIKDFNCTTSSVSTALSNTKDSPVLIDFFEDTGSYRKQAEKALEKYKEKNAEFASVKVDQMERVSRVRGGERTNYYFDFSVRNCSAYHFPRHPNVFGFCRAYFSYTVETSDLETPNDIFINCEIFNTEEHRNISGVHPNLDHYPAGRHEHSNETSPFRHKGSRNHHHSHKTHKFECPPPAEVKSYPEGPPGQTETPPPLYPSKPKCHHLHFHNNGSRPPLRPSSNKHHPHRHHPHGHHPHGQAHGHHFHGHHPHRHHPHGHHPHRHPPHGHHPPGHDFHDYGPCDPLPHRQDPKDDHHHGHDPPTKNSEERSPCRRNFPFPRSPFGHVYRLPPLEKGEVLPLPEANFPVFSLPCPNSPEPELHPFPQSASESCPGKSNDDFPRVSKFFRDSK
ncbi:histidine-rich glycoprotein [Suncus etruscus]|uniref:histidine-rich glycoprotein n=1 Tax=Suncus etruscus TaxID=109475 RepID=UPI00210F922B|nr:histidine-rich glycoprotein [Suncus etruscus]